MNMKVVCTHLYNDFSGSPLILSTLVQGFVNDGLEVEVITSSHEGFLSDIKGVSYVDNGYFFANNRFKRLLVFLWCQCTVFFKMLKYRNENVVVYINTLLPFGAALAAKMMGKKVIYHVHETSVKPASLKSFLKTIAAKTASQAIYVSKFLAKEEGLKGVPSEIIYNALSDNFIQQANKIKAIPKSKNDFTVLMLCSLKDYKGVKEFVQLAEKLPHLLFELVLNSKQEEIDNYFVDINIPENLILFPTQKNVHTFYKRASLVLNLSHPEQWVETFGMTLLEAMHYGLPSIAPPVGGCTEFVHNGVNGFQIDQRQLDTVAKKIQEISKDKSLYQSLSNNAITTAENFNVSSMRRSVIELL